MISFSKEQIFIVTGASSGIGEGTALLLNELGATVVGIARNKERLETMKSKCKYPENMFLEIKDLAEDINALPQYIKELKNKYGKFSGLAYCAGVCQVNPLQTIDYSEMKQMFDINYFAPVFMVKGIADKRNNVGEGASIVVISSVSALARDKGHLVYSGTKSALCASLKSISKELHKQKIRLNTILPSNIKTPMTASDNNDYEISQQALYPFGFGEVSDVSNMVAYLLSDKAKFISGQDYVLDSGGVI